MKTIVESSVKTTQTSAIAGQAQGISNLVSIFRSITANPLPISALLIHNF